MQKQHFIKTTIQTPAGDIPVVSTLLNFKDLLGAFRVRWGFNRDDYKVEPGLYAVGEPAGSSDVFVTANYKLSFDHLRKNLAGLNAWMLVLDTKGVNVWCAAGKGTFSTKELVKRIELTKLEQIINHRKIIVPQLGAVGISAFEVKQQTEISSTVFPVAQSSQKVTNGINFSTASLKTNRGFNVIFGPVRAADIKTFISNGYKSTKEMRKVTFSITDRTKLIPVDFMYGKYKLLAAFALIFILSGLSKQGISFHQAYTNGLSAILNLFLAYLTGVAITPILLPYFPARSFAFKGFLAGLPLFGVLLFFNRLGNSPVEIISWFLIISAIASFLAMNFTGSSTYTSLSGVKKEMKIALPIQICFSVIGLILFTIKNFI